MTGKDFEISVHTGCFCCCCDKTFERNNEGRVDLGSYSRIQSIVVGKAWWPGREAAGEQRAMNIGVLLFFPFDLDWGHRIVPPTFTVGLPTSISTL